MPVAVKHAKPVRASVKASTSRAAARGIRADDTAIIHSADVDGAALDAMFAEIDRNLDASEKRTARLLAALG